MNARSNVIIFFTLCLASLLALYADAFVERNTVKKFIIEERTKSLNKGLIHASKDNLYNVDSIYRLSAGALIEKEGGSKNSFWSSLISSLSVQYQDRLRADPLFLKKSILEGIWNYLFYESMSFLLTNDSLLVSRKVLLAAGTQFMAELNRRGTTNIITEIDFVVAGVLTAVAGKVIFDSIDL